VSHFDQLELRSLIDHTDGDVRDLDAVRKAFLRARPDIVIHLAAQPIVRRSYRDPKETFDTNVAGGVNVLEAVRESTSIRSLVFATSDKCYRNRETHVGYVETDELGGHDPYSASKAAAELVFSSYNDSFFVHREGFNAASARAGNVIGGGDWAEARIIPDCIRALANDEEIVIRSPRATRPWQHVLEPLSGYLVLAAALLDKPDTTGSWNFGPAEDSIHTVLDVVERSIKHWGTGSVRVEEADAKMHEAGLLNLNCSKAHSQLGWRPRWGFEATLEQTIGWYREQHAGTPAIELTRRQINDYAEARP
jgi:CDP-glucose 4,6-dehydratase